MTKEEQNVLKMFGHIKDLPKEDKIELYETIDNFLWDVDMTPDEFLDAFANHMDEKAKKRWFAKILTNTDLYNVLRIFTPKVIYKYAFDDEVIDMMFPDSHQHLWRNIRKNYQETIENGEN